MSFRPFSGLHICAGRYVSDCSEKIEYINVKSIKALLTRLTLAFHRWSALLRHINEFPRLRARHDAQFWRNHTHRRYNQLAQWWVMNHYTHAHKRVILCHTFDIWPLKNGYNSLHTVPHLNSNISPISVSLWCKIILYKEVIKNGFTFWVTDMYTFWEKTQNWFFSPLACKKVNRLY